jgi:hypothetical protein
VKLPQLASYRSVEDLATYLRSLVASLQQGWNVQHQSDGTHLTGHRCKVWLSAGQTVTTATATRVVLDTISWDRYDEFTPSTGLWTASAAMDVVVHVGVYCGNADPGYWGISIRHDKVSTGGATFVVAYQIDNPHVAMVMARHLTAVLTVARGDSIGVWVEQVTGGNQIVAAGENSTWMAIERVG